MRDKESTDYEPNCVFKVDEYGFFVYWKSDGREGNVAELSQVSDIRRAQLPRDPKLADRLLNKFGQDVEDKMLAICSGLDYVNINYTNIVCKTKDEADEVPVRLICIPARAYLSRISTPDPRNKTGCSHRGSLYWMRLWTKTQARDTDGGRKMAPS
ncbi:phospholipid phospholipase C beta isoform [Penaeus vannamei]|uniref:Phospholipid phospholipase C beta isoform n=1 Tax=Penaeus vannamei TaxID=6689 RepID=A0A3R7LXW3_PENVA|nr:phospholipid phospholipase C beta isoform [Penaeus vannamei]